MERAITAVTPDAYLTPPAHQQRAANIMAPGGFSNVPVFAKTFFYNANLLCIRPAPTAASIGDRKDLYFGSVSMVGHSAGSMLKSSAQKDGPRRGLTFQIRVAVMNGFTALGIPVTETVG